MMRTTAEYKSLSRLLFLAAGLFVAIWFAWQVLSVLLLVFFAIVIAIVLNAPVTWLQQRKFSRSAASLIVFLGLLFVFGLVGWMIIPKIVSQVKVLLNNLPDYIDKLTNYINGWLGDMGISTFKKEAVPAAPTQNQVMPVLGAVGKFSMELFQNILTVVFFFCLVAYMLFNPAPLLELYLACFPEDKKEKAATAFSNASTMTIGWMASNIIAGTLRATLVWIFLYFMDIPGVWVFAAITFFAELIPKIGFYLMALPPVLVAFSISPAKGLWVCGFLIALDELIGDFIIPRIRAKTMKIHPVSTLVMLLISMAAFGVMGAFISTPLTAFVKAFYEAFFQKKHDEKETAGYIDKMLFRK